MKKNLKLFIILIALVGLAYFYNGPLNNLKNWLGGSKNFLAKVDVKNLDRIEVVGGDQDVTLVREGEKWRIDGTKDFYVKENLGEAMTKNLEEAVEADLDLVSENKDKKAVFQTGDTGIKVKLIWDEKKEKEFIVGSITPDYGGTYISMVDDDKTYSVKSKLYNTFYYSQWYDKTIFSSDILKISKIRFQYPDREFTVEKVDDSWIGTIPYEFEVNSEKIKEVVDIMGHLIATKIPSQTFDGTDLDKHLIIVQATGEGIDNTIMLGSTTEEGLVYAKKGSSDNIYLVGSEKKAVLDKRIGDLK